MRSSLWTCVAAFVCNFCCPAVGQPATTTPESLDKYIPAIVKIEVTGVLRKTKQSKQEFGTGFIFHRDGFLLTAAHVLGEIDEWLEDSSGVSSSRVVKVYRKLPDQSQPPAQNAVVLYQDKQLDIALLRTYCEKECEYIKFGNSGLVSDNTSLQGIAWGKRIAAEKLPPSKVLSACDFKYFCLFKFNQLAIEPGDSGAPLFNEKFEVVGMIKSDTPDARGNVLATPMNFSASLRLLADMEQPEVRARFRAVEDSLGSLQKIAEDLRQNIRPVADWSTFLSAERIPERHLSLYVVRDFESQYLPQEIKVTVYPAWKVTPKGSDAGKVNEMSAFRSKEQNLSFVADSDAETIDNSIRTQTAILKPFESMFKSTLKSKFGFSDATLNTLVIMGAEVDLEWKVRDKPRSRTQFLGAAP